MMSIPNGEWTMLRKILVPLDGSELAEQALSQATALSVSTGATLILVRAAVGHTLPGADAGLAQARAIADAEEYLQVVATRLNDRGFRCEIAVPYGAAADWIQEEALLRHADLIVMSTHGRSGPQRWLFGSVAEEVVSKSSLPVLLVRAWLPEHRELLLEERPRVLVPMDGSTFAEAALPEAAALADEIGAELVLIRIQPRPTDVLKGEDGHVVAYLDQQEASLIREATEYLDSVAQNLTRRSPDVPVSTRTRLGDATAGIVGCAQEIGAALIVMATHGRTGLARMALGSVAGRVLETGSTPLILIRPFRPEHAAIPAGVHQRSVV
jgi:nucleotide-binding universal stress UspA family protein